MLIGSARTSAAAVELFLRGEGFVTRIWSSSLNGEASTFGYNLRATISELMMKEGKCLDEECSLFRGRQDGIHSYRRIHSDHKREGSWWKEPRDAVSLHQ